MSLWSRYKRWRKHVQKGIEHNSPNRQKPKKAHVKQHKQPSHKRMNVVTAQYKNVEKQTKQLQKHIKSPAKPTKRAVKYQTFNNLSGKYSKDTISHRLAAKSLSGDTPVKIFGKSLRVGESHLTDNLSDKDKKKVKSEAHKTAQDVYKTQTDTNGKKFAQGMLGSDKYVDKSTKQNTGKSIYTGKQTTKLTNGYYLVNKKNGKATNQVTVNSKDGVNADVEVPDGYVLWNGKNGKDMKTTTKMTVKTPKVADSSAYKAGREATKLLVSSAVPGGAELGAGKAAAVLGAKIAGEKVAAKVGADVAEKALAKAVLRKAGKVAVGAGATVVNNMPGNLAYSAMESKNGKEFKKNVISNAKWDLGLGAVGEVGHIASKAAKANTAVEDADKVMPRASKAVAEKETKEIAGKATPKAEEEARAINGHNQYNEATEQAKKVYSAKSKKLKKQTVSAIGGKYNVEKSLKVGDKEYVSVGTKDGKEMVFEKSDPASNTLVEPKEAESAIREMAINDARKAGNNVESKISERASKETETAKDASFGEIGGTKMAKGKARKALEKKQTFTDVSVDAKGNRVESKPYVATRKEYVERNIDKNFVKKKVDGKNEYRIEHADGSFSPITKTKYDYAAMIKKNGKPVDRTPEVSERYKALIEKAKARQKLKEQVATDMAIKRGTFEKKGELPRISEKDGKKYIVPTVEHKVTAETEVAGKSELKTAKQPKKEPKAKTSKNEHGQKVITTPDGKKYIVPEKYEEWNPEPPKRGKAKSAAGKADKAVDESKPKTDTTTPTEEGTPLTPTAENKRITEHKPKEGMKRSKNVENSTGVNGIVEDKATQSKVADDTEAGVLDYLPQSRKVAQERATQAVVSDADGEYERFMALTKANQDDIATAGELYKHFYKSDPEKASKAIEKASMLLTDNGRAVDAAKLLMKETPAGRLRTVENIAKKLEKIHEGRITTKDGRLYISDEVKKAIMEADPNDEKAVYDAMEKAQVALWDQIKASWLEKFNSFRYLAMLFNPKTHIRNFIGNYLFAPMRGIKNVLATGMESSAENLGIITKEQRTKTLLTPKKDKDLIEYGKADFEKQRAQITGNTGRWVTSSRPEGSPVFDTNFLQKLYSRNGKALNWGDMVAFKPAYGRAFARYMKVHGLAAENMSKKALMQARKVAMDEALRATYRDYTSVGNFLSKAKGVTPNSPTAKKIAAVAVEASVPFPKTPINILRRGWEYSLAGLVESTAKLIHAAAKKDGAEVVKQIDRMAAGLTGTGIFGLGAALNHMGILELKIDTSSPQGQYESGKGHLSFAVKIGDHEVTADWALPIAIPFFAGAQYDNLKANNELSLTSLLTSIGKAADPVMELSMMQGVMQAAQSMQSAKKGELGEAAINAIVYIATNYVTQAVPTALGQVARIVDPNVRTSSSTAKDSSNATIDRALTMAKNKVPGLSYTSQPKLDAWGNPVKAGGLAERIVENTIAPFNVSKLKETSVDKEIERVYKNADNEPGSVIPKQLTRAYYDMKVGDDKGRVNKEQVTLYNKTKGQLSYKRLKELMATDPYKSMSDDEKRAEIAKVYTNAAKAARAVTLFKMHDNKGKKFTTAAIMKSTYGMKDGDISRLKAYTKKGHSINDVIDMNTKFSSGSPKVLKAAYLIDGKANQDLINFYGVGSKVKQVKRYFHNGGNMTEIQNAAKYVKSNSKMAGKAMQLVQSGGSDALFGLFDESKSGTLSGKYKNAARGLIANGISNKQLQHIFSVGQSGGKRMLSKADAEALANRYGKTQQAKSALYEALSPWSTKDNPFGHYTFSQKDADKALKHKAAKKVAKKVVTKYVNNRDPRLYARQSNGYWVRKGKKLNVPEMPLDHDKLGFKNVPGLDTKIKSVKKTTLNGKRGEVITYQNGTQWFNPAKAVKVEKAVTDKSKPTGTLTSGADRSGGRSYSRRGRSGGSGGSGGSGRARAQKVPNLKALPRVEATAPPVHKGKIYKKSYKDKALKYYLKHYM